jgi:4-carboxymuconolactone decarboxylase
MDKAPMRIPPLPREQWTEAARDVFGYFEGETAREQGSRSNSIMVLAHHPSLALASLAFGRYLLLESTLAQRQKELVVLRVAWRYQSEYQWVQHVFTGRKIGMVDAEFDALQSDAIPASAFPPGEYALLSAVDQLCRSGRIDDPTWTALDASMNRHQLMDFLYAVGFFTMNAWAFGAMGVQVEAEYQPFSVLDDLESGGRRD